MNTIIKLVSATCTGLLLFQCQPSLVVNPAPAVLAASGSARTSAIATGIPVSGYTLCYQELFDSGTQPNSADWFKRTGVRLGGYNYASQVNVGNGTLNINFDYSGGQYKGGGIISTHTFGYGYYEIYCKLYRQTSGLHQSFWTMGINAATSDSAGYFLIEDDKLPAYNQVLEIDGYEQNSNDGKLACNHHIYSPKHEASIRQTTWPNPGNGWFKMGFEWRPDGITYYYDGVAIATKVLTSAPWNLYAPQNFWLTALPVPNGDFGWGKAVPPVAGASMQVGSFKYYAKKLTGVNLIGNPGFEYSNNEDASGKYPIGWIETRNYGFDPDRGYVTTNAANANFGSRYLVHGSYPTPYKCTTKQILEYIPHGTYKLTAHVRSSGGQKAAVMRVIQGGVERSINIPATLDWTAITLDNITVNSDELTIAFTSDTDGPGQWIAVDSVSLVAK